MKLKIILSTIIILYTIADNYSTALSGLPTAIENMPSQEEICKRNLSRCYGDGLDEYDKHARTYLLEYACDAHYAKACWRLALIYNTTYYFAATCLTGIEAACRAGCSQTFVMLGGSQRPCEIACKDGYEYSCKVLNGEAKPLPMIRGHEVIEIAINAIWNSLQGNVNSLDEQEEAKFSQ